MAMKEAERVLITGSGVPITLGKSLQQNQSEGSYNVSPRRSEKVMKYSDALFDILPNFQPIRVQG
jgi:hypothetical protein